MNNEIAVRTNKGEYFPGETVFGVVYLNVCRPTEATGIQVTFKGTELCTYKYESEGEQQELTSEAIHVDFTGVSLYSQDECFQFGSYAFPFKFELAKDIPGTFFCSGSTEATSWEVNISYSIQTSAFGADSMEVTQPVVIFETSEEDMRVGLMGTAVDYCWQVSRLPRRKIHLTAKLLENYVESGSNLQLRLIVTNTSKVTVTGFKVMLLRYLKLDMAVLETSKKAMVANMVFDNDDVYICPEGGPHVVRSAFVSIDSMIGNSVLDRLQIPLTEMLTTGISDIPPSVSGKHIKNQLGLEIAVTFSNGRTETANIYIPGVLPKKNEAIIGLKKPLAVENQTQNSGCSGHHQNGCSEVMSSYPRPCFLSLSSYFVQKHSVVCLHSKFYDNPKLLQIAPEMFHSTENILYLQLQLTFCLSVLSGIYYRNYLILFIITLIKHPRKSVVLDQMPCRNVDALG